MKILDVPQSGSVAGTTSSRNRFGQYRRSRATPVNPNTSFQQVVRAALKAFSQAWKGLAGSVQEAWRSYAADHPVTDSLGQSNVLTGLQAYVGVNLALSAAGLPAVTDPPVDAAPEPPLLSGLTTAAASAQVDFDPTPLPGTLALVLESSPPKSSGVSFNADFRSVLVLAPASVTPIDLVAALTPKFGTLLAGQRYFLRARVVRNDGAVSAWAPITMDVT